MTERIQLRRTKGWRKPEGAIVVARPSKWGNPFVVGEPIRRNDPLAVHLTIPGGWGAFGAITVLDRQATVDAFYDYLMNTPSLFLNLPELAGHDLACWCPLDQPCHADILLALANQGAPT